MVPGVNLDPGISCPLGELLSTGEEISSAGEKVLLSVWQRPLTVSAAMTKRAAVPLSQKWGLPSV